MLLVDGEEEVARAIMRGLARAGLSAAWASLGRTGLALKDTFQPHVMLVDLVLPDMDGRSLIAQLGHPRDCGVIVLSGMGEEADKGGGGGLCADDFIAKPLSLRETVASIHAVHQRLSLRGEGQHRIF